VKSSSGYQNDWRAGRSSRGVIRSRQRPLHTRIFWGVASASDALYAFFLSALSLRRVPGGQRETTGGGQVVAWRRSNVDGSEASRSTSTKVEFTRFISRPR